MEEASGISISRRCELLAVPRSTFYATPGGSETTLNLHLMRLIDEQYTATPFYGSRRMAVQLQRQGFEVNRKRLQRLMRLMGLEPIYPRPNLSRRHPRHRIYPYLLRNVAIERVDQVWSTDITYIRMARGFVYLVAVIDWYSRFVLSWQLSIGLAEEFCIEALERALAAGIPEIFNTDQGSQFTSEAFTKCLLGRGIPISMDGRGRALDNVFVERFWRAVKYEEVYLKDYQTVPEARAGLAAYIDFYNHRRPHQSLGYRTPAEVYNEARQRLSTTVDSPPPGPPTPGYYPMFYTRSPKGSGISEDSVKSCP